MKPVLAIDFDDVLADTFEKMTEFHNIMYKSSFIPSLATNTDRWHFWGDVNDWRKKVEEFHKTGWADLITPVKDAVETTRQLSENYDLFIVTGRGKTEKKWTDDYVQKYFPQIFKDIFYTGVGRENIPKSEACKQFGAKTIIDDWYRLCKDCPPAGIETVILERSWSFDNLDEKNSSGTIIKPDWKSVKKYLLR